MRFVILEYFKISLENHLSIVGLLLLIGLFSDEFLVFILKYLFMDGKKIWLLIYCLEVFF